MHPPHLAVVRELVDRGHRVTYLVGTHLADLARPTGADVIGFDSLLPGSPAVLRIADAFVSHAGMGSCTEALWYGVPTGAIPQGVDQPANAAQLEVVGVGRHLTADPPTPDEIHDAILEVAADPKIRPRLNGIREGLPRVGRPVARPMPSRTWQPDVGEVLRGASHRRGGFHRRR